MNDFFSYEGMYSNGVPATYRPTVLLEFGGNPLIETMPPLYSEIEASESLKYSLVVNPAIVKKAIHINAHTVTSAADVFTPLPIHLALYQQLDRVLRSGYLNHNPMVPRYHSGTNRAIVEMREQNKDSKVRQIKETNNE